MSDWYVSSVAWSAITAWAASTAYTVGQIVRPTAPATLAQYYAFRCTVAGTSGTTEPTWSGSSNNNATIVSGGATFTNVTGQSAYGWAAAGGTLLTFNNSTRGLVGDRIFVSSDHTETTVSTSYQFNNTTAAFGLMQIISVNRAGSVPPVAVDIQSGASVTAASTNSLALDAHCDMFWQGFTFTVGGSSAIHLFFNNALAAGKSHYLKNCSLIVSTTGATSKIGTNNTARVTLDNTTVRFGATGQTIASNGSGTSLELQWINTPSAIGGSTFPTTLLNNPTGGSLQVTCRGVDLSAIAGTLLSAPSTAAQQTKVLLDSCKIASGVTRYGTPAVGTVAHDEIELVNCHDGTNVINERHTAAGDVTIDRSTTMTGGAQDDVGAYSLKLVSSSRSDYCTLPLDAFWLDVGNSATGSSKTATVELISSASLNNIDIKLLLQYMGTSGSSVASFTESLPSVLAASSALPGSSATWNNPPVTPQKQYLQVTFTPQAAGRVRGLVRLGKASTTCWINPRITIA